MKRLALAILLLLIASPAIVAHATVTYSSDVSVSNNSTTAYPELGVTSSNNVTLLVSNGFIIASGLDTRVQQSGSNLPWMMATDRVTFVVPVPANSSNTYQFVTGQAAATSFQIVTGHGGHVTTNDTAVLEPGINFKDEINAYIDTSKADNIMSKGIFYTISGNGSGGVTASIISNNATAGTTTNVAKQGAQNSSQNPDGAIWWGQTFTANASGWMSSVQLGLTKVGAPLGNTYVTVYNVAGGVPSGANLTSVSVVANTIATGNNTFTFSNFPYLSSGQAYAIGIGTPNGNPGGGNYIGVRDNTTGGITGNEVVSSDNQSMWVINSATQPLQFEVAVKVVPIMSIGVAGVSDGEHLVTFQEDGANAWLTVGSLVSANTTAVSAPDTTDNYVFGSNVTPYYNSIKMTRAGLEKLRYQPVAIITNSQIPDLDGTKNGDITWGTNPSGVAVAFGGLSSTTVITANTTATGYVGNFLSSNVSANVSPTLNQANIAVQSDWLYGFVEPFATTSGTQPVWFYWFGTILFAIVGFLFAYKTKHLLIAAIAFDIPFAYGIAKGYVPPWVIIVLVLWTIGAVIQEARMG